MNIRQICVSPLQSGLRDVSFVFLAIPLTAVLFVSLYVQNPFISIVSYSLFFLLIVAPLAAGLGSLLLPKFHLSTLDSISLGYVPACFALSGTFLLTRPYGNLFCLIIAFASCLSLWYYLSRRDRSASSPPLHSLGGSSRLLLSSSVYLVAAGILFVFFSLPLRGHGSSHPLFIYQDVLWTIGNTWSIISKGLPLADIRLDGLTFSYHASQNIYYALSSTVTGIDPPLIHLTIAPYFDLFFLVFGIVAGFKRIARFSNFSSVTPVFLLLFSAGSLSWSTSGYLSHIYTNPVSLFFGLLPFSLVIPLLINHSRTGSLPVIYFAVIVLAAIASKALLVFMMLPSLLSYFLFDVIKRRAISVYLYTFSFCLLLGLILLRFTLFSSQQASFIFTFYEPSARCLMLTDGLSAFGNLRIVVCHSASILFNILKYASAFFGNLFVLISFVPFALSWAGLCRVPSRLKALLVYCFAFLFTSMLASSIIVFPGGYEYFLWYPAVNFVLASPFFVHFIPIPFHRAKVFRASLCLLPVSLFVNFCATWASSPWYRSALGGDSLLDQKAGLTSKELSALNWISSNLPEESVFATDRVGFKHESSGEFKGRFFGYSAFSGRQFFNEGYDFSGNDHRRAEGRRRQQLVLNLMHSESLSDARKNWRNINADYLIVSRRFSSPSMHFLATASVVYSNSDVLVVSRQSIDRQLAAVDLD